ncbi:MAG: metalloregulator ArsR/SmtB family transcription factor [Halobacteriales archaeon]|nr:metalloregulator ArsR/SmtB family transcription factor [Halobacteriales archaeon]
MSQKTERLERYLEDELGECRTEDVESRLEELGALREEAGRRFEDEIDVLSALGNETRYSLIRALVAAEEELCVCELGPVVDVSESGMSHALRELADAGLVEGRKEGRWKKYRATNRAVALVTVLEGVVGGD